MASLFYEDLQTSGSVTSRGRTVTESDVVTFAGLTGDFFELHTNEEYARQTKFGRRVAHGALVFSLSIGLSTRMNLMEDTVLAFMGVDRMRFIAPVFLGDTIHVVKRVVERIDVSPEAGAVTFETRVLNQNDAVVLVYLDKVLVRKRPAKAES